MIIHVIHMYIYVYIYIYMYIIDVDRSRPWTVFWCRLPVRARSRARDCFGNCGRCSACGAPGRAKLAPPPAAASGVRTPSGTAAAATRPSATSSARATTSGSRSASAIGCATGLPSRHHCSGSAGRRRPRRPMHACGSTGSGSEVLGATNLLGSRVSPTMHLCI